MKKHVSLIIFLLLSSITFSQPLSVYDLQCEYQKNPLGISNPYPRLSWKIKSPHFNTRQAAYQILVATQPGLLTPEKADMWNSGRIPSLHSVNNAYTGKPLKSGKTYFWKVKIEDWRGKKSAWSDIGSWTCGIINPKDWKAKWITENSSKQPKQQGEISARWYRKDFKLEGKVKKALIHISGLGYFELYLNGQKAGSQVLAPGDTDFEKRALYMSFDITELLNRKRNTIGVILGSGKYYSYLKNRTNWGYPQFIAQLEIIYENGTTQTIISDSSWKYTTRGPIVSNSEYNGEIYDARKEMDGWNQWGYNAEKWENVQISSAFPNELTIRNFPASEKITYLSPDTFFCVKPGIYIYDFGKNISGWVKINVEGTRGTKIKLRYAEILTDDKQLDTINLRGAAARDIYILKGKGKEVYQPRFTYHGFRYVEVSGVSAPLSQQNIFACYVHDNLMPAGNFTSSNPFLNQLYETAEQTTRNTYHSVPVDCPQRDERLGWLGDRATQLYGESFMFNTRGFYQKWLQDIVDAQHKDGYIPNIAPPYWNFRRENISWPVTAVFVADMLYRYYADQRSIAKAYPALRRWTHYIRRKFLNNGIVAVDQYGDWSLPDKSLSDDKPLPELRSSAEIIATVHYYKALKIMHQLSGIMQHEQDKTDFSDFMHEIEQHFTKKYLDTTSLHHTPTEMVLFLTSGLLSEKQENIFSKALIKKIKGQYDSNMCFGLIGMRWLMSVLVDQGYVDEAVEMALKTSYPSWGYMLKNGATTFWEDWDGSPKESHDHMILMGDLVSWFFQELGGIKPDFNNPGFKHFHLYPHIPSHIDRVAVTYNTNYGTIKSHWKTKNDSLFWRINVPENTTTRISFPADDYQDIKYETTTLKYIPGVKFVDETSRPDIIVGSGKYIFSMPFAPSPANTLQAPNIYPPQASTTNPLNVRLSSKHPDAKIYFTTNATSPDTSSQIYEDTLLIENYTIIKAITTLNGQKSYPKTAVIDIYNPAINGWNYKYFEGEWAKLPNLDTVKSLSKGKIHHLQIDSIKQRRDKWAMRFSSFLKITESGNYRFYLSSDDGANLYIDEKKIIDNNGIHYNTLKTGNIYLSKGYHPIRIDFFNYMTFSDLALLFSGNKIPRQPLPVSFLYFKSK